MKMLCICLCFIAGAYLSVVFGADTKDINKLDDDKQMTYNIELLMVADNAVFNWWGGLAESDEPYAREAETASLINQYYAFVFNGIRERFQSVIKGFKIDVSFVGLLINKTSTWTEDARETGTTNSLRGMVDSREALHNFLGWVNVTEHTADHIMLFTG
ncbi:hypothetical protein ScPMuIL_014239 [Solemya velum]